MTGLRGKRGRDRLLVLAYHNVESTWRWPAPPGHGARIFRQQMAALASIASVVPLSQALSDLYLGRPLPPRSVAVTFDDGYSDNLSIAAPILRDAGLPATVFLVPGFLSRESSAWWERLAWAVRTTRAGYVHFEGRQFPLSSNLDRVGALAAIENALKKLNLMGRVKKVREVVDDLDPSVRFEGDPLFLDWESAGVLGQSFAIGSHTMEHAILSRESRARQFTDLRMSRSLLEGRLGSPVQGLAYPNGAEGDYDQSAIQGAVAAGYTFAVSTRPGLNSAHTSRFEICRRLVQPNWPRWYFSARVLRDLGSAARL